MTKQISDADLLKELIEAQKTQAKLISILVERNKAVEKKNEERDNKLEQHIQQTQNENSWTAFGLLKRIIRSTATGASSVSAARALIKHCVIPLDLLDPRQTALLELLEVIAAQMLYPIAEDFIRLLENGLGKGLSAILDLLKKPIDVNETSRLIDVLTTNHPMLTTDIAITSNASSNRIEGDSDIKSLIESLIKRLEVIINTDSNSYTMAQSPAASIVPNSHTVPILPGSASKRRLSFHQLSDKSERPNTLLINGDLGYVSGDGTPIRTPTNQ